MRRKTKQKIQTIMVGVILLLIVSAVLYYIVFNKEAGGGFFNGYLALVSGGVCPIAECTETDGGNNPYLKGTITRRQVYSDGTVKTYTQSDECYSTTCRKIYEYYLEKSGGTQYMRNLVVDCGVAGGSNGACLGTPTTTTQATTTTTIINPTTSLPQQTTLWQTSTTVCQTCGGGSGGGNLLVDLWNYWLGWLWRLT
jgi:hypothetical protein